VERTVDLTGITGTEMLLGGAAAFCASTQKLSGSHLHEHVKHNFKRTSSGSTTQSAVACWKRPLTSRYTTSLPGRCLREINLEDHGMNVVFSILPAVRAAAESRNGLP